MTVITKDPKEYPIAKNPNKNLVCVDPKKDPITDEPNKDPIIDKKNPSKVHRNNYLAKVTVKVKVARKICFKNSASSEQVAAFIFVCKK